MKNFGVRLQTMLDYIRENVKSVTNRRFDIKNGVREQTEHCLREYTTGEERGSSIYYEKDGSVKLKQISTFDNAGNKTGFINYNGDGIKISFGKFELDQACNVISKSFNGVIEEVYKYNYEEKIIETLYPNTGGYDKYEYDRIGRYVVKQLSTRIESAFLQGTSKNKIILYENDFWGNVLDMKTYNAENNELLIHQKNTMNAKADEIESSTQNGDGSIFSHFKYDYVYDSKGNWILKKTLTPDGRVIKEHERIITYY